MMNQLKMSETRTWEKIEGETDMRNSKKMKVEMNLQKKKAVLIGLKHPDPEMNNAIDIKEQLLRMKVVLIKLRDFSEDNITLMIQDDEHYLQPTYFNISHTLSSLVDSAQRGTIIFIHLIAYGCSHGQILTADKEHLPDCYFRTLIRTAIHHCNLTFVSDCLIHPAAQCPCPQLPKLWDNQPPAKVLEIFFDLLSGRRGKMYLRRAWDHDPTNLSSVDILNLNDHKKTTQDHDHDDDSSSRVILLMPFQRDQNAPHRPNELFFPPPPPKGASSTQHTLYGGFTNALLDVIEQTHGQVTNLDLALKAMEKIGGEIPSLRCNHHHHAYASFV